MLSCSWLCKISSDHFLDLPKIKEYLRCYKHNFYTSQEMLSSYVSIIESGPKWLIFLWNVHLTLFHLKKPSKKKCKCLFEVKNEKKMPTVSPLRQVLFCIFAIFLENKCFWVALKFHDIFFVLIEHFLKTIWPLGIMLLKYFSANFRSPICIYNS